MLYTRVALCRVSGRGLVGRFGPFRSAEYASQTGLTAFCENSARCGLAKNLPEGSAEQEEDPQPEGERPRTVYRLVLRGETNQYSHIPIFQEKRVKGTVIDRKLRELKQRKINGDPKDSCGMRSKA